MPDFISSHPFTLQILMDQEVYLIPERAIKETETSMDTLIDFTSLKYFGNLQSKILLMVSDANYPVCADSERNLFKNICTAMNWTAKDYIIINTALNPVFAAQSWLTTLRPSVIILFDIPTFQFDMDISLNNITIENGTKIIKTQNLALLNQNRTHKISFWNELKKLKS